MESDKPLVTERVKKPKTDVKTILLSLSNAALFGMVVFLLGCSMFMAAYIAYLETQPIDILSLDVGERKRLRAGLNVGMIVLDKKIFTEHQRVILCGLKDGEAFCMDYTETFKKLNG